jgi:hypothetical protein
MRRSVVAVVMRFYVLLASVIVPLLQIGSEISQIDRRRVAMK